VWDKTRDGAPRVVPALEGERQITKQDLKGEDHTLSLKLRSKVDEREYD